MVRLFDVDERLHDLVGAARDAGVAEIDVAHALTKNGSLLLIRFQPRAAFFLDPRDLLLGFLARHVVAGQPRLFHLLPQIGDIGEASYVFGVRLIETRPLLL